MKQVKFTKKDFSDIWDHMHAAPISPSIVDKVVKRANEVLEIKQKELKETLKWK